MKTAVDSQSCSNTNSKSMADRRAEKDSNNIAYNRDLMMNGMGRDINTEDQIREGSGDNNTNINGDNNTNINGTNNMQDKNNKSNSNIEDNNKIKKTSNTIIKNKNTKHNPFTDQYNIKKKQMKYIIVTGGVISGVGKGVVSSSAGTILQQHSNITFIKIDPYMNIDAGNIRPSDHGEVFVLSDGAEVDLDLGNYERFLNINLTRSHSITAGKVFAKVLARERTGHFLGKTVQLVPHVTDTVIEMIEDASALRVLHGISGTGGDYREPDVCIVELGGTIGDIESTIFVEALRQLRMKAGQGNFVVISVDHVPTINGGEQKTKPLQNSMKTAQRLGLKADVIVARCEGLLDGEARDKIAMFGEVRHENIFCSPNVDSVYKVPAMLEDQGFADSLVRLLGLQAREGASVHSRFSFLFNHLDKQKAVEGVKNANKAVEGVKNANKAVEGVKNKVDNKVDNKVNNNVINKIKEINEMDDKWWGNKDKIDGDRIDSAENKSAGDVKDCDASIISTDGNVIENESDSDMCTCSNDTTDSDNDPKRLCKPVCTSTKCINSPPSIPHTIKITVVAKYVANKDCYLSVESALLFSSAKLCVDAQITFIDAEDLEKGSKEAIKILKASDAILVPGGFGVRGVEGKIMAARYARQNRIPFLGICLGFQVAVIEFARNVLGLAGATSEEFDEDAECKIIVRMDDYSKPVASNTMNEEGCLIYTAGNGTMRLGDHETVFNRECRARQIYNQDVILERHRHRYEVNTVYRNMFEEKELSFVGTDETGKRMEVLELADHPLFVGVQYHPEFNARPDSPHCLFTEFVRSAGSGI